MMIHQLRASLENPAVALDDWDVAEGTNYASDSGESITRKKALEYSPVFRAFNLISGDAAKLGCTIYERVGQGKERAKGHFAYNLLRWNPSPDVTYFHFYKQWVAHGLEGNGYAFVERDDMGHASEIYNLNPDHITPVRYSGTPYYVYEPPGLPPRTLNASDVLHIHGLGFDGLCGYSLYEYAKQSIGMGRAAQKYTNKFYGNNARPGVILEVPGKMEASVAKQYLATWNQMIGGLSNAHKAAMVTDGTKVHTIASGARENQLIESMQFSVRDVANFLGVPPHKLGDNSRTAYNSLEQENQSYLDEALDPWLVQMESELRSKILTEDEKRADSHVIEFNRKALLRSDMATRGEFYAKATGNRPWLTPDEVRGMENMNPMGGGAAELKDPTNNFGPAAGDSSGADSAASSSESTPPPDGDAENKAARSERLFAAADAAWHDARSRVATRLGNQAARAAKNSDDLRAWLDRIDAEAEYIAAMLGPAHGIRCAIYGDAPIKAAVATVIGSLVDALQPCLNQSTRDMHASAETAVAIWKQEMIK